MFQNKMKMNDIRKQHDNNLKRIHFILLTIALCAIGLGSMESRVDGDDTTPNNIISIIKRVFKANPIFKNVTVKQQNNKVTLGGIVLNKADKIAAGNIAIDLVGFANLKYKTDNQIHIKSDTTGTPISITVPPGSIVKSSLYYNFTVLIHFGNPPTVYTGTTGGILLNFIDTTNPSSPVFVAQYFVPVIPNPNPMLPPKDAPVPVGFMSSIVTGHTITVTCIAAQSTTVTPFTTTPPITTITSLGSTPVTIPVTLP